MNSSVSVCLAISTFSITSTIQKYQNPHFWEGRSSIVHLFEWKWKDVAAECERFLQYKGYGGVQVSPPNENVVIQDRPWWERYQPVSYKLETRSGNEEDFLEMTRRCNAVGIRIYVDAIFNHMTGGSGSGTAGSAAFHHNSTYPAVPFDTNHFNLPCTVNNYQDPVNVRNCRLGKLLDLDQSNSHVRGKIIRYLNHLINLGVAGFRIDAAKHMWPEDLKHIYSKLENLNVRFGFALNSRPFIYQEVLDYGGEAISKHEYTELGRVVEFKFSNSLSNMFRGNDMLTYLINWGPEWGLVASHNALVFIDNQDNQRDNSVTLTYKQAKQYKMAVAFMLSHPYGIARIMSSYFFDNWNQGPPADANGNLISPSIREDGTCSNGYVCEHRWRQIYQMVAFRNVVKGTELTNWWSNGHQQIAFCRGDRGFIVFTNHGDVDRTLQTCLPSGIYCDIISGSLENGRCTGKTVEVGKGGLAHITLRAFEEDRVLAIHVRAKLKFVELGSESIFTMYSQGAVIY